MPEIFRVRIAARKQITLPDEILELLRIGEGDTLELRVDVDKNVISGGCGLRLVPTSLFDKELLERLHERELEIASGAGISAKDIGELEAKVGRKPVLAISGT